MKCPSKLGLIKRWCCYSNISCLLRVFNAITLSSHIIFTVGHLQRSQQYLIFNFTRLIYQRFLIDIMTICKWTSNVKCQPSERNSILKNGFSLKVCGHILGFLNFLWFGKAWQTLNNLLRITTVLCIVLVSWTLQSPGCSCILPPSPVLGSPRRPPLKRTAPSQCSLWWPAMALSSRSSSSLRQLFL